MTKTKQPTCIRRGHDFGKPHVCAVNDMAEKGIHCISRVPIEDLPESSNRKPSRSVRENFSRVKLNVDVIESVISQTRGREAP